MKMEEKDFEPAGLIPRSIIRTVERFQQQLRPETVALGIQEFRISRYQVRVSVRYFFILLLLPISINWGAKNLIIKPLVGYFWNTYQTSLFLNNYQAERAFQEMRDFESQLFFEMLLSRPEKVSETWGDVNTETLYSTKQISLQKQNKSFFFFTSPSLRLKAPWTYVANPTTRVLMSTEPSTESKALPFAYSIEDGIPKVLQFWSTDFRPKLSIFHGKPMDQDFRNDIFWVFEPTGASVQSTSSNKFKQTQTSLSYKPQGYAMQGSHFLNKVQSLDLFAPLAPPCSAPLMQEGALVGLPPKGTSTPSCIKGALQGGAKRDVLSHSPNLNCPGAQDSHFLVFAPSYGPCQGPKPMASGLAPSCTLWTLCTECAFGASARSKAIGFGPIGPEPGALHKAHKVQAHCLPLQGTIPRSKPARLCRKISKNDQNVSNLGFSLENKVKSIEKNDIFLTTFINSNFCSNFIKEEKLYIGSTGIQIEKTDLCFASLFQQKTVLLAELYNQQSITALSNMFGDFVMILAIILLVRWNAPQFTILKSFLIESFYSFNDAIKCFYIILITDFLVGFHSPRGWEIAMEMLLRHLGLPENEEFILLFVGTFPVFLDTAFKYWIFRYLNKISPSTVATYHSMIE